ncbi:MAG: hypothetical protein ACKON8_04310, partial [Planctomycetota bacterium]
MTLIVGTDEAGYGPNLGPLVVAATLWEAEAAAADVEAACAAAAGALADLWGDSKRVFRGRGGLKSLERGALAAVARRDGLPGDWGALLAAVDAVGLADSEWAPEAERLVLPREGSREECAAATARASTVLAAHGLRLVAVRCRGVNPREFNGLLAAWLNKSDLLSRITRALAAA